MKTLARLAARRPGPLGALLLVPTWLLLGLALLLYVVAIMVLSFAVIVLATWRLVAGPPLALLGRLLARLPGVSHLLARRRLHRYAEQGLVALEDQLRTRPASRPGA